MVSVACVNGGAFLEPSSSVFGTAEGETRLPCQLNALELELKDKFNVVQVSWTRNNKDGTEQQIITAHHLEGKIETPDYKGRVRFEYSNPLENSALILLNTEPSDEGTYTCTITTFPLGSFKTKMSLTVWSKIIASVDPVILAEGQSYRVAATCRAAAKPLAGLSWETDLPGQSLNRTQEIGVSTIQFSLHPLRSMNGRKLDCLVWHPSLKNPRRISNQLVVHYSPDAAITGYDGNWYVGLEGATLQCDVDGNPKPDNFIWTRTGGSLPDGVTIEKEILRFNRPLSLTDKGVYECVATNQIGSGKAHLNVTVTGILQTFDKLLLTIIGGISAMVVLTLVIVIITVNHHHKKRNKLLAIELHEKKEEIDTLSRHASIRMGSSIDTKYQTDENTPLRVEGAQTSLSSLEHPQSRDSHSTLGGLDSLGRPVILNTSRRSRERTMTRERNGEKVPSRVRLDGSFTRISNMSLVASESHFQPPLHPSSYPVEHGVGNGSAILPARTRSYSGRGSFAGSQAGSRGHQTPLNFKYPVLTDKEEDDMKPADEDLRLPRGATEPDGIEKGGSETASFQISEAMSTHFEQTNGTLWPKQTPNSIMIQPETIRFSPPQTNIHQPQIV
ncbi:nectin-4 [Trichomycterus rosablanca]|uniref:nectin-4 n=1 Tax=Trichomycterus rosablanca TaxID=2290929 RepID=UPI002F353BB6